MRGTLNTGSLAVIISEIEGVLDNEYKWMN